MFSDVRVTFKNFFFNDFHILVWKFKNKFNLKNHCCKYLNHLNHRTTERQRNKETGRQGDREAGRQGDRVTKGIQLVKFIAQMQILEVFLGQKKFATKFFSEEG